MDEQYQRLNRGTANQNYARPDDDRDDKIHKRDCCSEANAVRSMWRFFNRRDKNIKHKRRLHRARQCYKTTYHHDNDNDNMGNANNDPGGLYNANKFFYGPRQGPSTPGGLNGNDHWAAY